MSDILKSVGLVMTGVACIVALPADLSVAEEQAANPDRFKNVTAIMEEYVDAGKIAGVATLIEMDGKTVYFEAPGWADVERQKRITEDTIFRLHSMTKPVVAVALMILHEEGKVGLDDPVSKFIPAFGDLVVHVEGRNPDMVTEPLKRAMTVRDVLTHQSGMSYSFFGPTPVHDMYKEAGLKNYAERKPDFSLAEQTDRLGRIPLVFQPGDRWLYGYSTDVVGRIVEVASGQDIGDFIRTRITEPLGMADTGYQVDASKLDRFSAAYGLDDNGGFRLIDDPATSDYLKPDKLKGGGTGLAGSIRDYLVFSRMLLNKGTYNGVRILKPETVELMTQDHIYRDNGNSYKPGMGFGFAMEVVLDDTAPGQIPGSKSEFAWAGSSHTFFWVNPERQLIYLVMAQYQPVRVHNFAEEIRQAVYESLGSIE